VFRPELHLINVLEKRVGRSEAGRVLYEAGKELGLPEGEYTSPVCVAYSLLRLDFQADEVSRVLSWRDFERLAGAIMHASGYEVRTNVFLRKPRAQIDVVAVGSSIILCVDCKHYRREQGPSSLGRVALAQIRRSGLLRKKMGDPRPIASVILSLSEPEGRFVKGVAIVPVRTLRSFLTTLDSYMDYLELL
jgi:hypothetical protein